MYYRNSLSKKIAGQYCYLITHGNNRPCWQSENTLCPVKMAFEKRERSHAIHKHFHGDKIVVEVIVATPLDEGNGEFNYVLEEFQNITGLPGLSENVLSICASCKKIRDSKGNWRHIETYFHNHTGADFSHDICPACMRRLHPEIADEMEMGKIEAIIAYHKTCLSERESYLPG